MHAKTLSSQISQIFFFRCHDPAAGRAPESGERCVADVLSTQVYGQVINDFCEPTLRVAARIHLYDGKQEGFLDDIPGILLGEPMPPGRAAN
jgi:hypothetical protein